MGGGYYRIHPALPWFFTALFTTTYGPVDGEAAVRVVLAYAAAMGRLGDYYWERYVSGRHEVVGALMAEEANLLHARRLARRHQRWRDVTSCMQGLRNLYEQLGRGAQWERLVDELVPDLTGPDDGPYPGREDHWSVFTEYRVRLARGRRDYDTALRLQTRLVAWDRDRAAAALARPAGQLTDVDRHRIHTLAPSLGTLGTILRERGDPQCLPAYQEAADLYRRIGARTEEGTAAYNIATAYLELPGLRDLDQAEHWYQTALDRTEPHDHVRRAQDIGQLGYVAYERFRDARAAGEPDDVLLAHLNTAAERYHEALDLTPANNPTDRGITHNQLGTIYHAAGKVDTALHHYQQAITHHEHTGNTYAAAQSRFNTALTLQQAGLGRIDDALHYAHAALRDYQSLTPTPADKIAKVRQLIADLEARLRREGAEPPDGG
jgi:tetratricopeptide (TPR) repeat protein